MTARLSRRSMVRLSAAAAVAVPSAAAISVSDPAIAAYLAVKSAEAAFDASADGPAADAAYDVLCGAIDRLIAARPTTFGGVLAKIAVARGRVADECYNDADNLLTSLLDIDPATITRLGGVHG